MKKLRFTKKQLIFIGALIAAIIIGLICAFIDFLAVNPPRTYSYSNVTLYYEEASSGVDPNGNRFYADTLLTDEVIENALASLGLSEKYAVGDVRKSLTLTGDYPKNLLRLITSYDSLTDTSISRTMTESNYYPTKYTFVLGNEFAKSISKKELTSLLDAIVDGYTKNFEESFSSSFSPEKISGIMAPSEHDYTYQIEIYRTQLELMRDSAKKLFDKRNDFREAGKSFNDIAIKCDSLINVNLSRINSFVTLNVLSNDVSSLTSYYQYILRQLNLQKDELSKNLETVTQYLTEYEKDSTLYISSGDQIVKVDGNSSVTYDNLVREQINAANELASVNSEIADCTRKIEDITSSSSKTSVKGTVEQDLLSLEKEIKTVSDEYGKMVEAYNEKYVNSDAIKSTDARYSSGKILSTAFVAECVKCVGSLCALVVLAAACVWLYDGIMEEKKKSKQ